MTKIRQCAIVALQVCDCEPGPVEEARRGPTDGGVREAVRIKGLLRSQGPFGLVMTHPSACGVRTASIASGANAGEIIQRHMNGGGDLWNDLQERIRGARFKHILVVCPASTLKAFGEAAFAQDPKILEKLRNTTFKQCQGFRISVGQQGQLNFSLIQ